MREPLSLAVIAAVVVLCAWAYPELNAWTYRRRIRRDDAESAKLADTSEPGADRAP
ncbi:MAG: hypothetical protein AVDCRST_MAG40-1695 [uncultured Gemmatimonadaceae bacterium]|uniref:Uncharacterized protein n=1 Tax=uncultured Gemmatimonadaceae bacterium TaxID=246130 RepID=A0A6J4LDF2_9BACT|nr:MAG: hypothetical protein AVDCRST_MAG40-1695 [uncultured Gemmatimonadaceae bacterium]